MMNGRRKSDSPVVATKPANTAGTPVAERVEGVISNSHSYSDFHWLSYGHSPFVADLQRQKGSTDQADF